MAKKIGFMGAFSLYVSLVEKALDAGGKPAGLAFLLDSVAKRRNPGVMASDPPKDPPAEAPSETAADVAVAPVAAPAAPPADVAAEPSVDTTEDDAGEVAKATRAAEAAVAGDAPPLLPAEPVSPAKEWAAAVVMMIVFGFICAAFIQMLRG